MKSTIQSVSATRKTTYLTLMLILALTLPVFGGCAQVGGSDYRTTGAQQAYQVEFGTVVSTRPVKINDGGVDTAVGAVGGGVIGGVVGNMIGAGQGNTLATIGGALLGALAGGGAGRAVGTQDGVEVTVTMDSGKNMVIVQGADLVFASGQRVRVTTGDGKTRVSPM